MNLGHIKSRLSTPKKAIKWFLEKYWGFFSVKHLDSSVDWEDNAIFTLALTMLCCWKCMRLSIPSIHHHVFSCVEWYKTKILFYFPWNRSFIDTDNASPPPCSPPHFYSRPRTKNRHQHVPIDVSESHLEELNTNQQTRDGFCVFCCHTLLL